MSLIAAKQRKTAEVLPLSKYTTSGDKSYADDLNKNGVL